VRPRLTLAAILALAPGSTDAQQLDLLVGRALLSPDYTVAALGYRPLALGPGGLWLTGRGYFGSPGDAVMVEGTLTITVHRVRLIGSAGFGSSLGSAARSTGTWSAGLGWDLVTTPVRLGLEGRYRSFDPLGQRGAEAAVRLAFPLGASRPPGGGGPVTAPGRPVGEGMARDVVDQALAVMGTPYAWGGSDTNGFDCSGLIQYAYARFDIALPRTSREQARAGTEVPRDPARLRPGDILVFSDRPGGSVTHVGLFVGDGRFIHSASDGVRLSVLSDDDPDARYWLPRWIGARRVLTGG